MALVFGLLLFRPPDAIGHEPQPAQSAPPAPTLANSDAMPAASDAAAARTVAAADAAVTFEVVDAGSSHPLDGVRLGFGVVRRFVALPSLVQLGTTSGGRLTVPLARVTPAQPHTKVVLTRRGHLPAIVDPPTESTCRVLMSKGREAWVRIVDRNSMPVRDARVTFIGGNVDTALLTDHAGDGECVAGNGAWFASVPCDDEGYASVCLPACEISVVARCDGWFQAKSVQAPRSGGERDRGLDAARDAGLAVLLEDASERGRALDVVMEPLQCAVLAARPSRILGKSMPRTETRDWKEVHNVHASAAADRVSRVLQQRFPGDLVFVRRLVPSARAPRDPGAPRLGVKVLVDGAGELDVQVPLQRFADVRLETLKVRARAPAPLGSLAADVVPGYAREWPQQLYVVRDDGTKSPVGFELPYGDACTVPIGRYRVFRRGRGGSMREELGVFEVVAAETCRIDAARLPARWPVLLRVADEHGSSPRFCHLRIRRRGSDDEWKSQPSEPSAFAVFLDEGVHEVFAAPDGKTWHRTEIAVRPADNRFDVRVVW